LSKIFIATGRTFLISLSLFTFATFIEAKLQTTLSHVLYFIEISQFSFVSSMNSDGEVF